MKYDEIKNAWNTQADDGKRWHSLSEAEKIEWAAIHAAAKARGPAPIFYSEAGRKLCDLQAKGFNVVGYVMEHCNDWQDNRRCTVDYNGLVRWVPSADQEVAKERAARQAAQAEVVALKERIARAGVEQRRAVREAVLVEREACAKVCDELVSASACARQIRARGEAHFAASKAQHEPLDEEAIEHATGVKRGTPMFLAATGFVRATERAHGITQENQA